ncbi:cilia- and flagella-associated protein 221 isoform X1 [Rhinoderma darwinii]|uniref:cilia- and flagella-associated protein 221 isoform X1 n=1 Tax=Rhinoderma darwinii TaxID=43563 RepID=UPI003F67B886
MDVASPSKFSLPKGDRSLKKPSSSSSSSVFLDSSMHKPMIRPVPHHLLESKVYRQLGSNVSVAADPGILHFGGFEIGRRLHQVLKLVNISCEVSNVHIIPPQSPHFTVSYKKANKLVPGLALTVNVQFTADEWRYYYDCIRVHCKGDETLLVPLHAYPVLDLLHFPSHVNLSDVALGQSAHHVLPLRCRCPVDFEFHIICSPPHKDFEISPTSGVLAACGPLEVTVTFTPSCYGTAQITLQLLITEFNAKPHLCVFTGTCSPNLTATKERPEKLQTSPQGGPQDCHDAWGGVSRKKRRLQTLQQNASCVPGLQDRGLPGRPSHPHVVSTPRKLSEKPVREGLTGSDKVKSRQEKETRFQHVVQQNVAEEETNQLRWQVHLGCNPISAKQRRIISDDRQIAEDEYKVMRGRPGIAGREATLAGCRRVLRHADESPGMQPQFDLYLNDLWANRHRALRRFQRAARTVLIRGRGNVRLSSLKKLMHRLRSEREESAGSSDEEISPLSPQQVLFYQSLPDPAEHDGPLVQDFVSLPPRPAAAALKLLLSFYDLKVPQYFKLMAYQPLRSLGASTVYQPQHLAGPLRRGAEDELLPEVTLPPDVPGSALRQALSVHSPRQREELLRPPETLLNPPDFHPMHVFNPTPGLLAFKGRLSYSEIDLEHHLCPLPRYPTEGTMRRLLRRQEIIGGVMSWKKFPTVSSWIPLPAIDDCKTRRCDPFSVDLLPVLAPPALRRLPAEVQEHVVPREGNETESKMWLTPDMLRAEFTLMQSRDRHDKPDVCEQRRESHVPEEGISLADKVRGRLKHMKLLSHNNRLILGSLENA